MLRTPKREISIIVFENPESEPALSTENIAWFREQAEVGLQDYRDGNFADITSPEERRRVLSAIRDLAKAEAAKERRSH